MAKKVSEKPVKVRKVKSKPEEASRIETGLYTTSTFEAGKLVNFDIDWDKLREHVKQATV
jgi:hypothetical protein